MIDEILTQELDEGWSKKEFEQIDLKDKRLNERLITVSEQFSSNPGAPINQACETWKDIKAAYRLFDNEKVTGNEILEPHQKRTVERMKGQKIVLALQDTTYYNYDNHKKNKNMGSIGKTKSKTNEYTHLGLIMHSTLASTTTGLPLGLLSLEIWPREEKEKISKEAYKKLPIEKKESYKWVKAFKKTEEMKPEETRVVTVCDREGDVYEFFVEAREVEGEILIRASRDRNLSNKEALLEITDLVIEKLENNIPQAKIKTLQNLKDKRLSRKELDDMLKELSFTKNEINIVANHANKKTRKLWEYMESQPLAGNIKIDIPKKEKSPERIAILEVRYGEVTLDPPLHRKKFEKEKMGSVTIDAVLVKEIGAPPDVEPLEWMLLTNVSVKNYRDALDRIKWYKCRWNIEVYHKIIKSGCKVEDCRLQTKERLVPYIVLFSIISWRLFWMTKINREEPESPCTAILGPHEWKALYAKIHSTDKLPEKLPTVRQAIRWIGQLGGFLGRKGDKEPGITAIWRGWERLQDFAQMWLVLKTC
ncbi:MAG: IS4 family transposase [Candidatus Margulisbacteria bacterium]|nr:IS4 family transposase [Candidatus Margulisiibacteriota bacterium]